MAIINMTSYGGAGEFINVVIGGKHALGMRGTVGKKAGPGAAANSLTESRIKVMAT